MTKSTQHPTAVRHVTFLVFPRVLLLDVAGPMQVFSSANQLAKNERYAVHVLGRHKGPVETDSGMQVVADLSFSDDVPKEIRRNRQAVKVCGFNRRLHL